MQENTQTNEMGTGSIPKLFFKLAIPAVVAQVVNLLYNIVDRIYIGHIPEVGATALTGVGLFNAMLMLITAFSMLGGAGGAPLAAIELGKNDNEKAEKIMTNSFLLLIVFSAILTVVLYIFAPNLLTLFGASEVTLPYAVDYARIYILGTVFVLIVTGMTPFVTTQGFAKVAMMTTVIGAVINIILDPIFIFVFDMGVKGAATATVLSQAVGALWVLRFLTGNKTILKLRKENMKLDPKIFGPSLALGISPFIMVSTESLLSISFTTSLAKYGGDIAVGAMTIITSINMLVTMPLQGFTQGGQPIMSYNYGAGNVDRVKKAFFMQFGVCVGYASLFWGLCMLVPNVFAGIFTTDVALAEYGAWAIRIYMAGIFSVGFQLSCQQSFMALGQAAISLVMAFLRKLILLIPLIFILPNFFADKVFGVFVAEPVSDIVAAAITTIVFFTQFKKIMGKINTTQISE
ncbi:MAG: MATE family efflux transporter [Agathobacter sp.]|nr:MATE family efflux transporter [Agathobacter sp.]